MNMKILTWNIYFDTLNLEKRTRKIVELVSETNADIVCFQEVRDKILYVIIDLMLNCGFYLPSAQVQSHRVKSFKYSTLTFVSNKFSNLEIKIIPYIETYMDRDILETKINGVSIYNVHLESTNSKQFKIAREKQLESLIDLVKKGKSVACGDFNITYPIKDNHINEIKLSNTYFSDRFSDSQFSANYDRVIFHNELDCEFLEYVGNALFEFGYCSDHNGIIFEFKQTT